MADILVVDDSPTMRNLVRRVLEIEGHAVTEAEDGLNGLKTATSQPLDLIVADINMPRMDGYQMISGIRDYKSKEDLPVIVLTTETSDRSKQKMKQVGANGWIAKPFEDDVLVKLINRFRN